jgi:hypothetical protein
VADEIEFQNGQFHDKESNLMGNKMNKIDPRRLSQSWRKHVRRLKQLARKTGTTYTPSRQAVSIPQPPKLPSSH